MRQWDEPNEITTRERTNKQQTSDTVNGALQSELTPPTTRWTTSHNTPSRASCMVPWQRAAAAHLL
jgi:hypothetical protein